MRRTLLCVVLMLMPGVGLAADGWTAQMEEDEGGPVMVASVAAAPVGDLTPMLRLMCGGSDEVGLRYETATDNAQPGSEADFLFENESTQVSKHMAYEEMDGAYAAYFPPSDPIVGLLETGSEVVISEATGNFAAQTFSLKGSSKAIGTLLKTCK